MRSNDESTLRADARAARFLAQHMPRFERLAQFQPHRSHRDRAELWESGIPIAA